MSIQQPWQNVNLREPKRTRSPLNKFRPLFVPEMPLRPLTVMADVLAFDEPGTQLEFLLGLMAKHPVKRFWYSDHGPPEHLPRNQHPYTKTQSVEGWVVRSEPSESGSHGVVHLDGERHVSSLVCWTNSLEEVVGTTSIPANYQSLPDPVAQMKHDVFAVLAAEAIESDLFITERDYLFETPLHLSRTVTVIRPLDALPLVGLYLRQQGQYINYRTTDGSGTSTYDRGKFYWGAARGLVPEAWRWMTACVQHSMHTDDLHLTYLSSSLLQRVDRALRARDRLLASLCQPQGNNTHSDSLVELDQICLFLMGAIDISARVAGIVLELQGRPKWQWKSWRERFFAKHSSLIEVLYAGNDPSQPRRGGRALSILGTLRNTIHGEALAAISLQSRGKPKGTFISLPRDQQEILLDNLDNLGGNEFWGIREFSPDRLSADPGTLVHRLFPLIIELINDLLRETPVERLSGVNLLPDQYVAPNDSPFDPNSRQRILWQLGL